MSAGEQHFKDIFNSSPSGEPLKIPIIEEKLVVSSKRIATVSLLISKKVLEEEALFNGTISSEELIVERKEINQYVEIAPEAVRQEGEVTIVSVMKEVLVVEKRLMLVEELHITKRVHQEQKSYAEKLRKEEVTISKGDPGTNI